MKKPSKKTLIGTCAGLIILGAPLLYFAFLAEKSTVEDSTNQDDYLNDIAALRAEKDYDGAIKRAEQIASQNVSDEAKLEAVITIGTLYETQGKTQAAYDKYREAEAASPALTLALAEAIGRTAMKLGDNKTAAEYYQHYIDLYPRDDPTYQLETDYYRAMIKKLEQQQ